jgi:hypothetical protein
VDKSHAARTLAGLDARILVSTFGAPTELALQELFRITRRILLIACSRLEVFDNSGFLEFAVEQFFRRQLCLFAQQLFDPELDSSEFDDIVILDVVKLPEIRNKELSFTYMRVNAWAFDWRCFNSASGDHLPNAAVAAVVAFRLDVLYPELLQWLVCFLLSLL